MIRLGLQLFLLTVCALVSVLLALRAWDLAFAPIVRQDSYVPIPAASQEIKISSPVQPPLSAFVATVNRPMFFEGRRYPEELRMAQPAKVPAPAPRRAKPTTLPSQFRLRGIVKFAGEWQALIEGPAVLLDWYSEGAKLGEWTLSGIESDCVFVTMDVNKARLQLFGDVEQAAGAHSRPPELKVPPKRLPQHQGSP